MFRRCGEELMKFITFSFVFFYGSDVLSQKLREECKLETENWILKGIFELNLLKPAGHVMHQQFNIQQLYVLPTLYLCVLYLSENKQRLVPLTA